jgi:hypothetical protein
VGEDALEGDDLGETLDPQLLGQVEASHAPFTQQAPDAVTPEVLGGLDGVVSFGAHGR